MSGRVYETPKRELLVFYYKYRLRLALAFLLPFLLAVGISFIPKPRYEAAGTLVVRMGSEYVYQPEVSTSTDNVANPIPFDRDQIYKAEVAILESHDLHQQVVETIGLDRMYPQQAGGVALPMREWILREIDGTYPDDAEIPDWVESVRDYVAGDTIDSNLSDEERNHKHLDMAVEQFGKRLQIILGKDSSVISVAFQHRDRAVAVQALDTLFKFYMEKRKQLYQDTRGAQAKNEAETTRRRAQAAQMAIETFKRQHQIYSLPDQRAQLLQQRDETAKKMTSVSSPVLDDKMHDIMAQLDNLDALEREYDVLQHDLQVANDESRIYVHKLDEAQTYDNMEHQRTGSVVVTQAPSAPREPKKLQGLIILLGGMISLMCVALTAALTEFGRSGFLTPERLERSLGLPVLGVVSRRK